MSLCYDFQKCIIISIASVSVSLGVGLLIQVVHGFQRITITDIIVNIPEDSQKTVRGIFDPLISGIAITHVNITKDSETVVRGFLNNTDPDITKIGVSLNVDTFDNKSNLLYTTEYNNNSNIFSNRLLTVADILKPLQKTDFVVRIPVDISKIHHIYIKVFANYCGNDIFMYNSSYVGCFGQQENFTRVDPRTKLPIE
jgi:hypothetical protein